MFTASRAAEIAKLGLSVKTIETHERRIQEKPDLTGAERLQAAAKEWVVERGGK